MSYLKALIVSSQISLQLLSISHLAWAPTWRKPNLHKLMTSAENQELGKTVPEVLSTAGCVENEDPKTKTEDLRPCGLKRRPTGFRHI